MRKLTFAESLALIGTMATVVSIPWIGPLFHLNLSQADASDVIDKPLPSSSAITPTQLPAVESAGPAFDCSKKVTWAETTICASAELGVLDRKLHREYQTTKTAMSPDERARLRHDEMIWVSGMRTCQPFGDGVDCLERYYNRRIAWLVDKRS